MAYPQRLLSDDEEILAQFRPHWRVLLPALGWAMLLATAGGVAFAALDPPADVIAAGLAVLLWIAVAARSVLARWFTTYVLTTERIVVRRGMIARTGTEIPLESVVNVLFSQSVFERLLGYGDVILESAGTQGQSVLADIPDPEGFQSEVYAAREERSLHIRGGGPAPSSDDHIASLERLADLRERGHLTDAEFEAGKRRLLGS